MSNLLSRDNATPDITDTEPLGTEELHVDELTIDILLDDDFVGSPVEDRRSAEVDRRVNVLPTNYTGPCRRYSTGRRDYDNEHAMVGHEDDILDDDEIAVLHDMLRALDEE